MLKRFIICVLPLLTGLLWIGAAPSQAAGESWRITDINASGCNDTDWDIDTHYDGLVPGAQYQWHTTVVSDGKVYMNESFTDDRTKSSDDEQWFLYSDFSGGPTENQASYPIAPGKPMKVVVTLGTSQGSPLSSWTMVAASCDSTRLIYNGPTAADLDEDFVPAPQDLCPGLKSFTADGCPVVERTVVLKARYGPTRVVGRVISSHATFVAGRPVTIWKVRPGPDRVVTTRTTTSLGKFKARVGKGRYYATAPALVVPTAGEVLADQSPTTRVR
jgi:hypothetical protein